MSKAAAEQKPKGGREDSRDIFEEGLWQTEEQQGPRKAGTFGKGWSMGQLLWAVAPTLWRAPWKLWGAETVGHPQRGELLQQCWQEVWIWTRKRECTETLPRLVQDGS